MGLNKPDASPLRRRLCHNPGEERFGLDRQSGSSALEYGCLELWVVELASNEIYSRACSPVADR
jgi:hypothetical protein